jgi:hypothetical protein
MSNILYVEDIIEIDYKKLSPLKIMFYQISIISFLRILISAFDEDNFAEHRDAICEYISWLQNSSEFLAKKINQDVHRNIDTCRIIRSSYNFCIDGFQCTKFYKKNGNCSYHHYTHNMVSKDIISLHNFIRNNSEYSNQDLNEIVSSIRTIQYVINHMFSELKNSKKKYDDYELYYAKNNVYNNNNTLAKFSMKKIPIVNNKCITNNKFSILSEFMS